MSNGNEITRTRLIDGEVHIRQSDGTWTPAPADQTDWDRVDSMSDEDIETAARKEAEELGLDLDARPTRVVLPFRADET